jgi:hypothetical protein
MLDATCHCGAVRISVPDRPEYLVDCNCSICRRNGALWAFYTAKSIKLSGHPENTTAYIWGRRTIRTMHCKVCGCITHWEPLAADAEETVGVNARNFEASAIEGVRVRKFDGAATWAYID